MSQVEEKTPISDHREGTVLFNKGVWAMLGIREVPSVTPPPLTPPPPLQKKKKKNRNPDLQKCNFENLGQMKFKQCKATKDAQNTLVTINNSTPGFNPSVPSLMIKFRHKKYQSCRFTIL